MAATKSAKFWTLPDRGCLAMIHYSLAVLYGLFLMVHVYLATTGKKIGSLFKGMINGYHEE
ncbi:MAG: hypothetical protein LBQ10_02445 [Desulfovibrio sp.]|jgi:thiosulfate reductase cytochrome b subunit|nr:hypothetical protein [Desulfovibrio sp.]